MLASLGKTNAVKETYLSLIIIHLTCARLLVTENERIDEMASCFSQSMDVFGRGKKKPLRKQEKNTNKRKRGELLNQN